MIGTSPAFLSMLDHISRVAAIPRSVLILGERGSGKELAAARLHYLSHVWDGPFVTLNCAALSPTLLDAELFGAEAGAYTGSTKRRQGRFERADGGTLFLDEVGTAPAEVQEKLLRAIEYGSFERVGGETSLTADVRVIAATNEDLPQAVQQGRFRADLLDRLTFDVVHVPPLKHRPEDITALALHFMIEMAAELGWSHRPEVSDIVFDQLLAHHWPGNVRELKNTCERAVAHTALDAVISTLKLDVMTAPWSIEPQKPSSAPKNQDASNPSGPYDFKSLLDATATQWLTSALHQNLGNQTATAKYLGLSYFQLRHLLTKHKISL